MATYSQKVLKGDELYYYTLKLQQKFQQIEQGAASGREELEQSIQELDSKVDQNKEATDQAIQELSDKHDSDLEELEQKINDLKLELRVMGGADYSEYYYAGNTYETLGEARAAAEAAGDEDPVITHSNEIVRLLDKDGQEVSNPTHNYLYLVPAGDGDPATSTDQPNVYNEYIWEEIDGEGKYELIGSTDVDLAELHNDDIDAIWNAVFN